MSDTTQTARGGAALFHRVLVVALPLLVLIQATLAGQYLFEQEDVIVLHGILGNTSFAITVLLVVLAVVRRLSGLHFGLAVALRSEEHTSALQQLMRISYAVY